MSYESSSTYTSFKNTVSRDFFQLMCSDYLGRGIGREVFASSLDDSVVIKFEDSRESFQNIMEWETWKDVQQTEYAKWFAPCVSISPCGTVLVQKRTQPRAPKYYPAEMPNFLADFKHSNYGWYKGHIVAHDYGRSLLMMNGLSKKMRKVEWWADIDS